MTSAEWIRYISDNEFTKYELFWIYCCAMCWHSLLTDTENLLTVTRAMLDKGMDPNQLVSEDLPSDDPEDYFYQTPMIESTRFGDNSAGVKSLELLLEHGGDPNIIYYKSGYYEESVHQFYREDVFVHGPDLPPTTFYGVLLTTVYGGIWYEGEPSFVLLIDAPLSIFKDYERYWYKYEHEGPDQYSSTMYVIEKDTGRRVAKYAKVTDYEGLNDELES